MKAITVPIGMFVFLLIGINLPLLAAEENMLLEQHEAAERELAFLFAPIKSKSDLQVYLAENTLRQTPFGKLSQGAQQRFLKSLVFTDRGLASFDYRDLKRELTAGDIYELLSLFGAQRTTFSIPDLKSLSATDEFVTMLSCGATVCICDSGCDYPEYWCSSTATCSAKKGSVCIGSNC
jgi:hypothetical protein